jgi:hypothetical protein
MTKTLIPSLMMVIAGFLLAWCTLRFVRLLYSLSFVCCNLS